MSEIFPPRQESPYSQGSEALWRQELGTSNPSWSDRRWDNLPYDTTLPEGFEEVTEITEIDDTAPDLQSDSSNTTDNKQPDTSGARMNEEEVAQARELVASMFNGHTSETTTLPAEPEILDQLEKHSELERQFAIPRGWTTLIHGTDSSRWQLGEREKVVQGIQGLSVITSEDRERYQADAIRVGNPNAYDTTASYTRSSDGSTDVVPVEVRVLFYKEAMSPRYSTSEDIADIKAALPVETSQLIQKYYPSRHPMVPRGETLVYMGGDTDEQSGREVEYFVPASVAEAYKAAIDTQEEQADKEHAEKLFETGTLLVRALDSPRIVKTPEGPGFDYDVIDNELEYLQDEEGDGLSYASSTLLLPGKRISTYKGFGFMFDGSESELHHLHTQDSGSNGQGKDFRAAESNITSLAELAEAIKDNPTPPMNEVNASFREPNLVGIFANEADKPTNKLDAWFARYHMTERMDKQLPLYIYDTSVGAIQQWEPTLEEIKILIEGSYAENNVWRLAYLNELRKVVNGQQSLKQ